MYVYWLVGAFFDDIETVTLAVSLVRTFESIGSSVAFGVGASAASPMVNLIIAFAMFGLTIPATSAVVFMVPERPVDLRKDEAGSSGGESDGTEAGEAPLKSTSAAELTGSSLS